ncbi:hypothetical protein FBU30_005098 [Linnemannia zychae]|nr:hypothetical protein FBU30_005098 [Linnemannia zychae]
MSLDGNTSQFHGTSNVELINSRLIDGPIAKGGGGRGGGGRGGRGGSHSGSHGLPPGLRLNPPTLPPIVLIPGFGDGGYNVSTSGYSSSALSSYNPSRAAKTSNIVGAAVGVIFTITVAISMTILHFKSKKKVQQEAEDTETNANEQGALVGPDDIICGHKPSDISDTPLTVEDDKKSRSKNKQTSTNNLVPVYHDSQSPYPMPIPSHSSQSALHDMESIPYSQDQSIQPQVSAQAPSSSSFPVNLPIASTKS